MTQSTEPTVEDVNRFMLAFGKAVEEAYADLGRKFDAVADAILAADRSE